jgi:hypothetical protein
MNINDYTQTRYIIPTNTEVTYTVTVEYDGPDSAEISISGHSEFLIDTAEVWLSIGADEADLMAQVFTTISNQLKK